MGQIYGSAETVYSWVGPRDHSLAFESLKRLASLCRPRKHDGDCELQIKSLWWYPSLWRQTDKSDERRSRSKAWNAIDDLFFDKYWSRVWIFQEVVLARQMHLMSSGDSTLSWDDLQTATRGLQDLSARLQEGQEKMPFFMSSWAWLSLKMFPDWYNVVIMIVGKKMTNFSDAMVKATPVKSKSSKFSQEAYDKEITDLKSQMEKIQWWLSLLSADFTATDPRDHIYGTLAITRLPIVPDYTKTVSDVYMDYAARWIKAHCFFRDNPLPELEANPEKYSPLAFLSFAGAHGSIPSVDIPSWVPNFTVGRNHDRHVFGRQEKDHGPAFRRDGKNDPYIVPDTRSLHVWGYQLELTSAFTSSTNSAKFDNAGQFKGILKYGSFVSGFILRHPQYVSGTSSSAATAALLAQPHSSDITPEAAICLCRLSQYMASHYVDHGLQSSSGPTPSRADPVPPFHNWAPGIFKAAFPDTMLDQLGLRSDYFVRKPNTRTFTVDYHHWFLTLEDTRELTYFETSSGYVGMGTVDVDEGDLLCVFQGCGAPAVVRKTTDGHYEFRGTVLVMDLDPQRFIEANGTQPQWFELR
ncbi:hypothetical protein CEP51_004256 [Fusarium floridanum]|uniref:Heterokaryon incompatibility domain-containing protein n=1 Tax=Fusarium floridanum TaxID=1325733 RepID=A0A428S1Z3_9HYPO|nr:hypothetical protein CEP51_004256 [Fusarium floridanum]